MPNYATPAELWAYMGNTGEPDAPFVGAVTPLLRRASSLVTTAIRGALYAVDGSGVPTDALKRDAVRDATCEQAMSWQRAGIDPYVAMTPTQVRAIATKSLGSASVQYEANPQMQAAWNALASGEELTGTSWRILLDAGLLSTNVQSVGAGRDVHALWYPVDLATGNVGSVPL